VERGGAIVRSGRIRSVHCGDDAAIGLSVPTGRFEGEDEGCVQTIAAAAQRISRRLGYVQAPLKAAA